MGPHASRHARIVLEAIRRIVRLLRQSAREAERRTGLSAAQLFVLQQLGAAGGALTGAISSIPNAQERRSCAT